MAVVWHKTNYANVRYYEHDSRKTKNGQPDKYYTIRYQTNKQRIEEGLGWASEGWSAAKASAILGRIKEAVKTGSGPTSLAGMRLQGDHERRQRQKALELDAARDITLRQFFERYYMPLAMKEKRSWKTDKQRIDKHINPALGDIPLALVKQSDIQAMLDDLAKTLAPATVKQYMTIVRRAYNMAAAIFIGSQALFSGANPSKGVKLARVVNTRERFLTKQEAGAIIADAKGKRSADLHDAIILSLNTGLRLGELMRLAWMDVDMNHAIVTVREAERRKPGGKVPLNGKALAIFKARWKRRGSSSLVFPPVYGAALRNISKEFATLDAVKALNKDIAVSDRRQRVVFHTLRHTFASWLALAGTDIYRIKTLMRHKTIEMTMRYAHLIPDATRAAVDKL